MIRLSCGHEIDNLYTDKSFTILTKSNDRESGKALSLETVCGACEDKYRQVDAIFDEWEDGIAWLQTEEW